VDIPHGAISAIVFPECLTLLPLRALSCPFGHLSAQLHEPSGCDHIGRGALHHLRFKKSCNSAITMSAFAAASKGPGIRSTCAPHFVCACCMPGPPAALRPRSASTWCRNAYDQWHVERPELLGELTSAVIQISRDEVRLAHGGSLEDVGEPHHGRKGRVLKRAHVVGEFENYR